MRWIKEATAGTYPIGPFMDGSGAILGSLNIIMADIFLAKEGGVFGTIAGTPTAFADSGGYYKMVLNTTDTNTRGVLRAYVNKATALPLWEDFMVVPSLNYDSLFGADRFQVDLRELGDATLDFTTTMQTRIGSISSGSLTSLAGSLGYLPNIVGSLDSFITILAEVLSNQSMIQVNEVYLDNLQGSLPVLNTKLIDIQGSLGQIPSINNQVGSLGYLFNIVGSIGWISVQHGSLGYLPNILGSLGQIPSINNQIGSLGYLFNIVGSIGYLSVQHGSFGYLPNILGSLGQIPSMNTKLDTIAGYIDTEVTAIKAKTDNLPSGVPKNVALSNFMFAMVLALDHITPATGKTVTATISKDGGAFAACTNAVAEVSNGYYKINLTQTEMNASVVALKFGETDCDQRSITIITST